MSELRLFEASPAWTIEDDTLVGFDLSFTRGARLSGLDPTCDTDAALEDISRRLNEVLCAVPDNSVIRLHSIEIADYNELLESYSSQFPADSVGAYVAKKKVEHCAKRLAPRRRELFCFVSTAPQMGFNATSPSFLGRRTTRLVERARAAHNDGVQQATRLVQTITRALHGAGVLAEQLDSQDLFATLWRFANPQQARRLEPPQLRHDQSLRHQLFTDGLFNELDRFQRAGQLNRIATLKLPPKHLVPTQILELQSLPFAHHLVVTLRRVSDADAIKRVETNRRQGHEINRLFARLRGADRHEAMPDHGLVQQQHDVNDILARLTAGEKLYDAAVQVWFAASSEEDLQRQSETVLSRFRACGQAEAALEELRGRFAFLSLLPGHHSLLGDRTHPFLASRAADLLPVFGSASGSQNPTAILATRSNELVGFHPFDTTLPAWNATVAGTTGSGKSFAVRVLLAGWLAAKGRVVVVTRGRDYHRYAEIFGGAVCDISLDDPNLALGPFPTPADLARHANPDVALSHLASIIAIMVTEGDGTVDRQKRRLIHNATQALYASLDANAPAPVFMDWLTALDGLSHDPEDAAIGRDLRKQMLFWLEGPFGAAFCRNRNVAGQQLSVWNLEKIPDADTQGVILGVLSGIIAQSIKDGPTIVVLDEVWSIFRSDAGATLVETLYRTVRKEGSAIWTISQSMNDYVSLPDATRSAILNNSPLKLFLSHDSSELALVTSTFQLSSREAELLASLRSEPGRYSELLAFSGKRRQVLKLTPTGIEYWLATSHPKDRDWEQLAMREFPQLERLDLLKRLSRRWPHGALNAKA